MLVVGLTGGIASGKSVVSKIFKSLGAHIIDADKLARKLVEPHSEVWKEVVACFGKEILNPDETLNRSKLAKLVFNDYNLLRELNRIVHPPLVRALGEEIKRIKEGGSQGIIILDAAVLIEMGAMPLVDRLVVVTVDERVQVKRLMKRDNLSKEEALKRINSQLPLGEKVKLANYAIDNSGSQEETEKQAKRVWEELLRLDKERKIGELKTLN